MKLLEPDGRFQQLRKLTELGRALAEEVSAEHVLGRTLREAASLLGTERVALAVAGPDGAVRVRASPAAQGRLERLAPAALRSLDDEAVEAVRAALEEGAGSGGFLAVPLVVSGRVAGVLAVARAPGSGLGAEDDEWLLSAVADQAAVSLERLELTASAASAEKARRQREEQFLGLYHSPVIGLVFRDRDGTVCDANDAFLAMSGYARADVEAGALRWDALTVRKLVRGWPAEEGAGAAGPGHAAKARAAESDLIRKDGQRIELLVGTTHLEEQDADLLFAIDVSAQKRAESSLRILSETSKALLGASLDIEALFKSIAWLVVPRFADWCAIEAVEEGAAIGRHVALEHLSASEVERALEWRRRYSPDPRSTVGVAEVIRSGRSQLHRELHEGFLAEYACESEEESELRRRGLRSAILVPMLLHGQVLGVITFVRAATRRRFAKEDLALAEEIARRAVSAVENARLYQRAQEAIGLRDEFLSVAAHELKTPLTVLQLQLDTLRRTVDRALAGDPRVGSNMRSLARQVGRLTRLVEDLLDVSRITAGKMTLNRELVDLGSLVGDVLAQFDGLADQVGTSIHAELPGEPLRGWWDRIRLEQVVANIVSNALKYGAGKPVRVAVGMKEGMAELNVKDEGIGLSRQDAGRIFGPFERAASIRHYGGLGLGLFIARQIVIAHGGDIHVQSEPGRGAEFTVRLPRLTGAEAGDAARSDAT